MCSLFRVLQVRLAVLICDYRLLLKAIHSRKRRITLDHKTCTVKNHYYLNFDGKCVDQCPAGTTGLGKGPQGRFCSRTWVPFAITTSDSCAENLQFGTSSVDEKAILVTFPLPTNIMSTSTFYNDFLLMTFCNSKAYGSFTRLPL